MTAGDLMNRTSRSVTRALVLLMASVAAALVVAASSLGCGSPLSNSATTVATSDATTAVSDSTTQATSGSTTTTAPAKATASAAGVTLEYPGGWYSQANGGSGLTLVERQEDLTADRPAGARLTLEAADDGSADMTALLAEALPAGTDPAAVGAGLAVVEEPAAIEVAGEQAVSITVSEESGAQSIITKYVIVELEGGKVLMFTLQAPKDRWDSERAALETILQSARFLD
jgi:hypothetical protein